MKEEKENNRGKYKQWKKSQNGITLVALVITVIIIIILATVAISFAFGDNGLINRAEDAGQMYANDTAYTESSITNVESYINDILLGTGENGEKPPVSQEPATDGSFSTAKGVNTPNIGANMQLVVFDSGTNTWVEDTTKEAYSYVDTSIPGNENKSEWANAKVTTQVDGQNIESYFVWIPRYAYKITYYTDESKETESATPTIYGTIDVKFIKGTGKTTVDNIECKYASENPTADDYIVHPAFTDEEENGGWDEQLPGIWIGKYEASSVEGNGGNSDLDNVTTKHVQVKPGVSCWGNIDIGNMYTVAKAYEPNLGSHMLKNSEWGAVAYLTDSKYGRNGIEVTINNNGETYYTGGGADNTYVTSTLQSSTGNVYGIYDLVGNAWEYVASYYNGEDVNININNGLSFASINGSSDKYSTAYDGTDINTDYKYGDATYETAGWHGDYAGFVTDNPFFSHGGDIEWGADRAGIFFVSSCYRWG